MLDVSHSTPSKYGYRTSFLAKVDPLEPLEDGTETPWIFAAPSGDLLHSYIGY
jgi:hypothetical protein